MNFNDINFKEIYEDLRPKTKVELIFKMNHFIIGNFTVMDLIILLSVFFGISFTLDKCTNLEFVFCILIALSVCIGIEYFRMKWRYVKTLQYAEKKAARLKVQLEEYSRFIEETGSEEERRDIQEYLEKAKMAERMLHELTDLAFEKDVLGLPDEES